MGRKKMPLTKCLHSLMWKWTCTGYPPIQFVKNFGQKLYQQTDLIQYTMKKYSSLEKLFYRSWLFYDLVCTMKTTNYWVREFYLLKTSKLVIDILLCELRA